ncbi:MAG: anti-sigma factor family protein [Gemmatimonadaceae bacterium]
MTHEIITNLLDDYLTGDLSEEVRILVANHVSSCTICSAEIENAERIRARVAQLPNAIDPPPEAWTAIRSAILEPETDASNVPAQTVKRFRRRRIMTAAAAAAITAILSSAGTVLYINSRHSDARMPGLSAASGEAATPAVLAAFTTEENNYLRTAGTLQDLLDQQESSLAPETVAQLRASLRTIDEAILEARTALARDPANRLLMDMVSSNYRQKVDLLRRSTEITRGT